MLGGRSGDRGRCAQPCRQPYRIRSQKTGKACYPLSLKDMCTIDLIPELMDAEIDSFKIEGRMKRAEYVAGVTDVYRRRIDEYLENPQKKREVPPQDRKLLSTLYVRSGLGNGYLKKHNGRDMITLDQPGYAGCEEGELTEIRSRILERTMELPVSLTAELEAGKPFRLTAMAGKEMVCLEGETVQRAQKRPLGEEEVRRQLAKTGGSGFRAEKITVRMEGEVFLPVKAINELRRSALEKLRAGRIADCRRQSGTDAETEKDALSGLAAVSSARPEPAPSLTQPELPEKRPAPCSLSASVTTLPQFLACLNAGVSRIYVSYAAMNGEMEDGLKAAKAEGISSEIFLSLPVILRAETRKQMKRVKALLDTGLFEGAQTPSPSGLMWLKENGWKGKIAFDHRIYIWNRQTWEYWSADMDTYCAPLELNGRDVLALPSPEEGKRGREEILVYGRIPMMVTANCIRKTAGECPKDVCSERGAKAEAGNGRTGKKLLLIDRYQAEFPVVTDCRFCVNVIYNSVPLSLHGYLGELAESGAAFLRLDFLEENGKETEEILRLFENGLSGKQVQPEYAFTTGHFRKGAQ